MKPVTLRETPEHRDVWTGRGAVPELWVWRYGWADRWLDRWHGWKGRVWGA